jgi:fibronectin type 3 domain-containing protein
VVTLTWTDPNSTETAFRIERSVNGAAFQPLVTLGANTVTRSLGVTAGATYAYRIKASNAGGDSAFSAPASVSVLRAPVPATGRAVSSTLVTLTWADPNPNDTAFKVERRVGAGAITQIAVVAASARTYNTLTSPGTTYTYRVRAANASGDSSYATTPVLTTLAAPTSLAARSVSRSQITVNWGNVAGETGFKVERSADGGRSYTQIALVGANVLSYVNSGLEPGRRYYYRVRATNRSGDSSYSAPVTAVTPP